jgi:ABC-type Fe3+ transport system substrate-binding protein
MISGRRLRLAFALLSFTLVTLGASGTSHRAYAAESPLLYSGADREQVLIEGARREGEVMLYSAMIVNQTLRPLAEAFSKRYPFIKLNYWRAESAGIFTKLSAEERAGRVAADVVEGTGVGEAVVQAGFAQPYKTPAIEGIAPVYRDPKSLWTATRLSYFGVGYNTKLVPPDAVPKRYEDLLDPRWKGKIVWHAGSSSGAPLFVTNLRLKWGDERTRDYLKKLAEQKVVALTGTSARGLVDRVIAGEFAIALNIFAHHPLISHAKGAPSLSVLMDPVPTTVGTMIIPKGLPHPHAAMLLADFILSREGQAILADSEYFPSRADVPTMASLTPITDTLKTVSEQFVSPENLVKYTPSSEEMISELFR